MRVIYLIVFLLLGNISLAQTISNSEEVFKVVEEMPRFPGCENPAFSKEEKKKCSEENLLKFIYGNIQYPDSAIVNNAEGKVVVQFVVGKMGDLQDLTILRDIGHGCGEEVLRVLQILNEQNVKWIPGRKVGVAVNVLYTLPVKFELQDPPPPPPPYNIIEGDTVYHTFTQQATYEGGMEALEQFLAINTTYPESGIDSCSVGTFTVNLLVRDNGNVKVLNTIDYSNLGTDFLFEAIKIAPSTQGKWQAAIFEEKKVNSIFPMRIDFKPATESCKSVVEDFEKYDNLVKEGFKLNDQEKSEEGLQKINEALEIFPENTEWLYYKGMILFGMERNGEACEAFQIIRNLQIVPWYDNWIDMICRL